MAMNQERIRDSNISNTDWLEDEEEKKTDELLLQPEDNFAHLPKKSDMQTQEKKPADAVGGGDGNEGFKELTHNELSKLTLA